MRVLATRGRSVLGITAGLVVAAGLSLSGLSGCSSDVKDAVPQETADAAKLTDAKAGDLSPKDNGSPASSSDAAASSSGSAREMSLAEVFPFSVRRKAPSLDGGVAWLNTPGPVDIEKL